MRRGCKAGFRTVVCSNAGRMLIEKLMSGLYMGDCARRLLLSFARHANLFNGAVPETLTQADSFTTAGERVLPGPQVPVKAGAVVSRLCSTHKIAHENTGMGGLLLAFISVTICNLVCNLGQWLLYKKQLE